eukprot:COSAG02_NODE_187_length_30377_cov_3.636271_28_plen_48_part_00
MLGVRFRPGLPLTAAQPASAACITFASCRHGIAFGRYQRQTHNIAVC